MSLSLLDLATSPPLVVDTLPTPWAGGGTAALSVAMSADGKTIVVVDGTADDGYQAGCILTKLKDRPSAIVGSSPG